MWKLTSRSGIIVRDEPTTWWNTGRVTAVLPLTGRRVLAASSHAGVWIVEADGTAISVGDWKLPSANLGTDVPRYRCLAEAHDGRLVAGGLGGLHVSMGTQALGGWIAVPVPSGGVDPVQVKEIAFVDDVSGPLIVLATDQGVLWSPFPSGGAPASAYTWIQTNVTTPADSVVAGTNGSVFVGAEASISKAPGDPMTEILKGRLVQGELSFARCQLQASIQSQRFGPISLAGSAGHPESLYAIVGDRATNTLLALLRWIEGADGNGVWVQLPTPVDADLAAAGLFHRNRSIAVCSHDPSRVAFTAGTYEVPWVSDDWGQTWTTSFPGVRLHSDMNSIAFDPHDHPGLRLVVSGDGGIFASDNFNTSYSSDYSRDLPILMFYVNDGGRFADVHDAQGGLLLGALQDNGVVMEAKESTPWRQVAGGDGVQVAFLGGNRLLWQSNMTPTPVVQAFDPNAIRVLSTVRLATAETPPNPLTGVAQPNGALVQPRFTPIVVSIADFQPPGGVRPLAFGAAGPQLFWLVDDLVSRSWSLLMTLVSNADITGVSTDHAGSRVRLGTNNGRIIDVGVSSATPHIVEQIDGHIDGVNASSTLRITDLWSDPYSIDAIDFGIARPGQYSAGSIIRSIAGDRSRWQTAAATMPDGLGVNSLAVDREGGRLFALTSLDIWLSDDQGDSWTRFMKGGLPKTIYPSTILFRNHLDDGPCLYMTTYGASAWRIAV